MTHLDTLKAILESVAVLERRVAALEAYIQADAGANGEAGESRTHAAPGSRSDSLPAPAPKHLCGLEGFGLGSGDVCAACEAENKWHTEPNTGGLLLPSTAPAPEPSEEAITAYGAGENASSSSHARRRVYDGLRAAYAIDVPRLEREAGERMVRKFAEYLHNNLNPGGSLGFLFVRTRVSAQTALMEWAERFLKEGA